MFATVCLLYLFGRPVGYIGFFFCSSIWIYDCCYVHVPWSPSELEENPTTIWSCMDWLADLHSTLDSYLNNWQARSYPGGSRRTSWVGSCTCINVFHVKTRKSYLLVPPFWSQVLAARGYPLVQLLSSHLLSPCSTVVVALCCWVSWISTFCSVELHLFDCTCTPHLVIKFLIIPRDVWVWIYFYTLPAWVLYNLMVYSVSGWKFEFTLVCHWVIHASECLSHALIWPVLNRQKQSVPIFKLCRGGVAGVTYLCINFHAITVSCCWLNLLWQTYRNFHPRLSGFAAYVYQR